MKTAKAIGSKSVSWWSGTFNGRLAVLPVSAKKPTNGAVLEIGLSDEEPWSREVTVPAGVPLDQVMAAVLHLAEHTQCPVLDLVTVEQRPAATRIFSSMSDNRLWLVIEHEPSSRVKRQVRTCLRALVTLAKVMQENKQVDPRCYRVVPV
jgi:hypothetical protein